MAFLSRSSLFSSIKLPTSQMGCFFHLALLQFLNLDFLDLAWTTYIWLSDDEQDWWWTAPAASEYVVCYRPVRMGSTLKRDYVALSSHSVALCLI
jgi:hypothetical protein